MSLAARLGAEGPLHVQRPIMAPATDVRAAGNDRQRTRRSMTASALLHALLFVALLFSHPAHTERPALTEITLLEPGDLGGDPAPEVVAPAAQQAPRVTPGGAVAHIDVANFRRATPTAAIAPVPQSDDAMADRLEARLATLQQASMAPMALPVASTTPGAAWSAPADVPGPGGHGASPIALRRGGPGAGASPTLTLSRGTGAGLGPALAPATLPVGRTTEAAAAPTGGGAAGAPRLIAGASLMGPIADRPVRSVVTPTYPEWAKRDAVEGSVTLYFVVRADGTIKENVLVQKTAGFEDFDDNARTALRAWRFEPLHGGRVGEQWGTITFHFRIRDAG